MFVTPVLSRGPHGVTYLRQFGERELQLVLHELQARVLAQLGREVLLEVLVLRGQVLYRLLGLTQALHPGAVRHHRLSAGLSEGLQLDNGHLLHVLLVVML